MGGRPFLGVRGLSVLEQEIDQMMDPLCLLAFGHEVEESRKANFGLHKQTCAQPVHLLGHIHPLPTQPAPDQPGQLVPRHVLEGSPQDLSERLYLGLRANARERTEHPRHRQQRYPLVFRTRRHVVEMLIGKLLRADASAVHGGEGIGDDLRVGLESLEEPARPSILRVADEPGNRMASGGEPREQIEGQGPAESYFVETLKRIRTGKFVFG